MNEPEIIINGINIGPGCAMTIRVAIEVFAYQLIEDNKTAENEYVLELNKKYFERINDIRKTMGTIK